jgi:hypothetical protein
MITEIIWFITWPFLILISWVVVATVVNKYEKLHGSK